MKKQFLLLPFLVLFLMSCGNEDTESALDGEAITEEDIFTTQIEGEVPPVTNFYIAKVGFDGQSVVGLSSTTFNITADKGVYWLEWIYKDESEHEEYAEVTSIIERTPGASYELLTKSIDGQVSYIITKVSDDGIWKMTSSRDDYPNFLCDLDAADMHANDESGDSDETLEEIVASIGNQWIELTKDGDEWIIYNECRYGSGGMYIDETGSWIEFSGGGDADSKDVVEMVRIDYNKIRITFSEDAMVANHEIILTSTGEDMLIMNEGSDNERAFVLSSATNLVRTVDEECDEEDM